VVGLDILAWRFVTHNEGFDFAMALPDAAGIETDLVAIVRRRERRTRHRVDAFEPHHTSPLRANHRDRPVPSEIMAVKLRRYGETVEIDQSAAGHFANLPRIVKRRSPACKRALG